MPGEVITLDQAVEPARTGDIWEFRGTSGADRAIRGLTNAPVNNVGMAVALDDLPPLQWGQRYGQRGWVRQLSGDVTREHEDGLLRAIARLDGTPFPSTTALAGRWLRGRVPQLRHGHRRGARSGDTDGDSDGDQHAAALETAYCAEVVAVTFNE